MMQSSTRLLIVFMILSVIAEARKGIGAEVTVTNPGFDYTTNGDGNQPPNAPGQLSTDPLESYTSGASDSSFNQVLHGPGPGLQFPTNGTAHFPGWVATAGAGAESLSSSRYFAAPDGAAGFADAGESLTQTIRGGLLPATTCVLSVELYERSDGITFPSASNIVVGLRDGNGIDLGGTSVVMDPTTNTTLANTPGKAVYTVTTRDDVSGPDLQVYLGNTSAADQVNFDNVTLIEMPAVPEPASTALLTVSVAVLILRKKFRRGRSRENV